MSLLLKFNYIPYKVLIVNKCIGLNLCSYSNIYIYLYVYKLFFKYVVSSTLFDTDNLRNTLLQIEMNFNIGSTIYIIFHSD